MVNLRVSGNLTLTIYLVVVITVWSILTCCSTAVLGQEPEQPNIIFILTDDQGVESIEGNPWPGGANVVYTPTLSRLS